MDKLGVEIPEYYADGTLLKYGQAEAWDMKKAGGKLADSLVWLESPPKVRLTPHSIKLMQTGAFYLFGRDKYYKPTFVMDCEVMVRLLKEDPAYITLDVFLDLFAFLWEYVTRTMFLPG